MMSYIMLAAVCILIGWMIGSAARVEREQDPLRQFEQAEAGQAPPGLGAVIVFLLLIVLVFWLLASPI